MLKYSNLEKINILKSKFLEKYKIDFEILSLSMYEDIFKNKIDEIFINKLSEHCFDHCYKIFESLIMIDNLKTESYINICYYIASIKGGTYE